MIQLALSDLPLAELAENSVDHGRSDQTSPHADNACVGRINDLLKEGLEVIENLQPYPGSSSSSDYNGLLTLDTEVSYVTPDLIVEKEGEEWVVALADGTLPPFASTAVCRLTQGSQTKEGTGRGQDLRFQEAQRCKMVN